MNGLNATTGAPLSGMDHLIQSIHDILTTPIGTRVMRRDYGSRLFDLIDQPINGGLIVDIYAAVAQALDRWEPRLKLKRVQVARTKAGRIEIDLAGEYRPNGQQIKLEGIVIGAAP
ncbi:MAG: GPW/gp25 family protein [Pseudomonadota bacterium]